MELCRILLCLYFFFPASKGGLGEWCGGEGRRSLCALGLAALSLFALALW